VPVRGIVGSWIAKSHDEMWNLCPGLCLC
jgi:hypothetical protein